MIPATQPQECECPLCQIELLVLHEMGPTYDRREHRVCVLANRATTEKLKRLWLKGPRPNLCTSGLAIQLHMVFGPCQEVPDDHVAFAGPTRPFRLAKVFSAYD